MATYVIGGIAIDPGSPYLTALGPGAGVSNTTGGANTASGYQAMYSNTTGNNNTASGVQALYYNTTGNDNTASGTQALYSNTTGGANTASGYRTLYSNTTGGVNTASGYQALYQYNNTGGASGFLIGMGYQAGYNYTGTELHNIIIGYNLGVVGESDMLRIGNPAIGTGYGQIQFSMLGLVGTGVPPIYGAGLNVSLGTTSTPVASYTPTSATGQRYIITWSLACKVASTPTLTLTYTDPNAGAQTITLYNTAMVTNAVANGTYPIVATSAAAIAIAGLDSVALGDIFASADIVRTQ